MSTSFSRSPSLLLTSESVTEGHPDKMCDQISDAVLDACIAQDPDSRVACETATSTGLILVFGEITTMASIDLEKIVRGVVRDIGYTDSDYGYDAHTCSVISAINKQSADISVGITNSWEVREEEREHPYDQQGAGDQGIMVGFACNETEELMPLPISLAHRLTRRLAVVRRSGEIPYLRPDGKSQVTVEYMNGKPKRISAIVVSSQHAEDVNYDDIHQDIKKHVINYEIPSHLLDDETKIYINPTGRFVVGGPMGDAGLTGRKIIVDTYGGLARHGGGAFSGKDPSKVDRSGAYAARWVAKNLVAAGITDRIEVQVSYAIGVARPTSVAIETFGTASIDEEQIIKLIEEFFDLRPAAILENLNLKRPIYQQTAAYGHFGRPDIDLPWEDVGIAAHLRKKLT